MLRIAAELRHRIAHRGKIDHGGHAGEILHEDAGGTILDLAGRGAVHLPVDQGLDVLDGDGDAVLEAEQVLEQDLHRERELVDSAELGGGLGEGEIGVGLAAHVEGGAGAECVLAGGCHLLSPFSRYAEFAGALARWGRRGKGTAPSRKAVRRI